MVFQNSCKLNAFVMQPGITFYVIPGSLYLQKNYDNLDIEGV